MPDVVFRVLLTRSPRNARMVEGMDSLTVSDHVATLRGEIATLNWANRLYLATTRHTNVERQGQTYRRDRLQRIVDELIGLACRRGPSTQFLMLRKRQDWAA